jgi:hypothetical protein
MPSSGPGDTDALQEHLRGEHDDGCAIFHCYFCHKLGWHEDWEDALTECPYCEATHQDARRAQSRYRPWPDGCISTVVYETSSGRSEVDRREVSPHSRWHRLGQSPSPPEECDCGMGYRPHYGTIEHEWWLWSQEQQGLL